MGAKGAVEILHRKASPDERHALELDYESQFLTPYVAAERASITAVIIPDETRREVAAAFELLATKQERLRPRRHDNSPL
jgi:acetyl-CoA carboxylase carboxyltransferase component